MKTFSFGCYLLYFLAVIPSYAQKGTSKTYSDGHGGTITLPMGDKSFADEVVSYEKGNPDPAEQYTNPKAALGPPGFNGGDTGFVSLGCGGTLILKFTDNALVNIEGPDLYVFEVGPYAEPTLLSISKDGKKWIQVGKITGGVCAVDIGDSVKTGEKFNYVRLTDLKSSCTQTDLSPGADIDAVAAIGSGEQINLNSAILFNSGQSELKPQAKTELNKIVSQVKDYTGVRIIIEGHTDDVGSDESNLELSKKRAQSVSAYFEQTLKGKKLDIKYYGYGEQYPIAPNNTPAGREKNRRVELVILPLK